MAREHRHHAEVMRRYNARLREEALADKVCYCCGSSNKIELDHIAGVPDPVARRPKSNGQAALQEYKRNPSIFQFLCRQCNNSKYRNAFCRKHSKYLGIWNHLHQLMDLDSVPSVGTGPYPLLAHNGQERWSVFPQNSITSSISAAWQRPIHDDAEPTPLCERVNL